MDHLPGDLQISQLWREDQYGEKGITVVFFTPFKNLQPFFITFVENKKEIAFFKLTGSIAFKKVKIR